ncbi:hypothetical protein N7456_005757 [Penicillium angulare]|uniref:F-box domain-containing protein n=1 Tax=Penicillium angulare TaxID=116970 RepID=A0A9W9KKU9_9EURO|nr:hypothetical protein N7456_005757 [Penicillium angulare]
MYLHHLPPELLLLLATFLARQRDINSLPQVNRRLYYLISPYLYKQDARGSNIALFWGSKYGNEHTVRKCLQAGANVQAIDRGRTPLFLAAEHGNETIVKLLLETDGIDPDWRRWDDRTPLSSAAEHGHAEAVKLLLSTGQVDVDSKDINLWTPLHWAADSESKYEAVVKILLEVGRADVDSEDYFRNTPLLLASYKGHQDIVKMMLETGEVDIHSGPFDGWLGLHTTALSGYMIVQERLSQFGLGDVTASLGDSEKWTIHSLAILDACQAIPKLVLEKEEYERVTYPKERALCLAAKYGRRAMVRLLLETGQMGVDPNDTSRYIPLAQVKKYGYETMFILLFGGFLLEDSESMDRKW